MGFPVVSVYLAGSTPADPKYSKEENIAMAKIEFEFDGTAYTLEYSRRSQSTMERNGFVMDELTTKPQTMIPLLFRGAFMMHHPRIKEEDVNAIYKRLGDKTELISALVECYQSATETLFEDPEDDSKKVQWRKA